MHMGKLLAANAAATDNVVLEIGQASSSYNDGYIGFNYAGSGSANNYLTFGLNGVDHVLNITGSGNVGIGTTAPITMLTIGANSNTTTRYQQAFQSYSNTISYPQILLNNPGANYLGVGFDTAGNLAFGTATAANANWANEYLVMSQSGNVGIGSTSPQGTLDVEGGTAASGNGSTINLAAQNGQASGNTNGGNIILTPGTAHGTGTGGAVGIGSASPAAGMKADIAGPVKVAGSGSETCTAATYGAIRYNQAGGYFEVCSP
jgi:hypothetical protein